jgi:hypothetical protein
MRARGIDGFEELSDVRFSRGGHEIGPLGDGRGSGHGSGFGGVSGFRRVLPSRNETDRQGSRGYGYQDDSE